ncbi:CatB-related O-acetyltransferase [Dietzia sp. DQ11-71]|nr:CatB-related O-acetyltransferase [Dietzia sp. DQ11-71]MBB1017020.1 CatB-related O-acetyltransferase [Dietzia sp. DQ11-71]
MTSKFSKKKKKKKLLIDLQSMTSSQQPTLSKILAIGGRVARGLNNRALMGDLSRLVATGNLVVGRGSYGLPLISISNPSDQVFIGDFCSIGPEVRMIPGGEHNLGAISTFPFAVRARTEAFDSEVDKKGPIRIGNDVWIGARATILSGVTIGHGGVVAAGALVNRDVLPFEIVGGVPCRKLGFRFTGSDASKILATQWWLLSDEMLTPLIPLLSRSDVNEFCEAVELARRIA